MNSRAALFFCLGFVCIATRAEWALDFAVGPELGVSGKVLKNADGTINDQTVRIQNQGWEDIYGPIYRFSLSYSRPLTPINHLVLTASAGYGTADEEVVGKVNGLADLRATFDDYQDIGLDLGTRTLLQLAGKWEMGVAGTVGVRWVEAISAEMRAPDAGIDLGTVGMYDDSTVLALSAKVQVLYAVSSVWRLGLETGVQWQDKLDQIEGLDGTGLSDTNDAARRISVPILLTARARF